MKKKIAILGGSFNPPGIHHYEIAKMLTEHFDEVVIVPCGPRPDKATVSDVAPVHRATMADLTFGKLPQTRVDLFDLEMDEFTRNHRLLEMYKDSGDIWFVIGADLVQDGREGKSPIHTVWDNGPELWRTCNFAVMGRKGFDMDEKDLPPNHMLFEHEHTGSSTEIRKRLFEYRDVESLVTPEVFGYMQRYGLYHGRIPSRSTRMHLENPRALLVFDKENGQVMHMARQLFNENGKSDDNPEVVAVIGGDGTMLKAIRRYWRQRLPFLGINAGHRGFLLNEASKFTRMDDGQDVILWQMPLLFVELFYKDNGCKSVLAFNDAWVERKSLQAAWVRVKVDGNIMIDKLIGDGVLVSTAAGSTAYARAMGATPLPVDASELLLVGSNVLEPSNWKFAMLSSNSVVEFGAIDPGKRPLLGIVDGVYQGEVKMMRVRASRIAAAELAFSPGHDLAAKIRDVQFPK